MQFGKVDCPELIDFTLPVDHPKTNIVLKDRFSKDVEQQIHIGCAKWNRTDLKNFYPRGTKDELAYYSSQFNSIEMNASFYRIFPPEQFAAWRDKTPKSFKFFPKVTQTISHIKRLKECEQFVDEYVHSVGSLEEKLGCVFLQMHSNFSPKDFDRVQQFAAYWPQHIPLAIEFRHTNWYNDEVVFDELCNLLEERNISNVITDTAGRRDLMHMRLTNSTAFIRYVGANHESDYTRLDDWVLRLKKWKEQGIQNIHFFVHQNTELESPLLSSYFVEKLNVALELNMHVPVNLLRKSPDLFS